MTAKDFLNKIRVENNAELSIKQKMLYVLLNFVFGIILGFLSKYIEAIPHFGIFGDFLNLLGDISSKIGMWIFIATIISCWSQAPGLGAINVFAFVSGMLLTYYIYSMKLFGFFPTHYFLRWGLIAFASPLAAYIVWFGRGTGWIAALCAALPIGLLIEQGFSFFYSFSPSHGFDIVVSVILFILLPTKKYQRLRVLPLVFFIAFILRHFNILSYFIGGL